MGFNGKPEEKFRCEFVKANGERCKSYKIRGKKYCHFHSPKIREKKKFNIIDEIKNPEGVFYNLGLNGDSWSGWRTILKAIFGISLTPKETDFYESLSGRRRIPKQCREFWCISGRRSGKSFITALISVYSALFREYPNLQKGETGFVMIVSPTRQNSQVIMNYCKEILDLPALRKKVKQIKKDEIILKNNTAISVMTANKYYGRGRTAIALIAEELNFWPTENSSSPDIEILSSLYPCLSTVENGMVIGISSAYDRTGLLYEKYSKFYGKSEGDKLVIKAKSLDLNPTLDEGFIQDRLASDYERYSAEFLSEFRMNVLAFLNSEAIESSISWNTRQLPPENGIRYIAYTDGAGGSSQSGDSFSLCVGHRNKDKKIIIDYIEEAKPPFSPKKVIQNFAKILKTYGVHKVTGDRWSPGTLADLWKDEGIIYEVNEITTSETYKESAIAFHTGLVELLDNQKANNQLKGLVRHTRKGGNDLVTHRPSSHDDLATAVCGVVYLLNSNRILDLNSPEIEMSLPISSKIFNENIPGDPVPGWYQPKPGETVIEIEGQKRLFRTMPSLKERIKHERSKSHDCPSQDEIGQKVIQKSQ